MNTPAGERDAAIEQALYPWRVTELRAIQAAWNRRGAENWTLSEVLSVLIGQEHRRVLERAEREGDNDDTKPTADNDSPTA